MLYLRFFAFIFCLSVLFGASCGYVTAQGNIQISDPTQEDAIADTGTSSGDISTIAERMGREIARIKWPQQGESPRVAVLPIDNQTRFRIDPKLLQNKLVKDLVRFAQGRVLFLARDSEAAVLTEQHKKKTGLYDQNKDKKGLFGADYLLKGEMRALSKASREGISDYIVYSFTLIDAQSSAILWMEDYETKKTGTIGVVYQ